MTMHLFWLDSQPDDERPDHLALHASRYLAHAWNGFHVPIVTASEFNRWIGAMAVNDPHGDWLDTVVIADEHTMVVDWACGWQDVFLALDGPKGASVYAIDGLQWSDPDEVGLFKTEQAATP